MKLCADGVGLNSENEGNVGHWGKKPYALLKANYVHFPCCYYFFKKNIIIFWGATVLFMLIVCSVEHYCAVPSEVPCDGDLLWLLLHGW